VTSDEQERKLEELMLSLEYLRKKGKFVDVQICPHCKSEKVRRVGSMSGDMMGHIALALPKFECLSCGWRGRTAIFATNRPLDRKQMEVAVDAFELGKR
jgi:hypothetical protein